MNDCVFNLKTNQKTIHHRIFKFNDLNVGYHILSPYPPDWIKLSLIVNKTGPQKLTEPK